MSTTATENKSGYFRTYFEDHPKEVGKRSNKAVIAKWLADHPGEKKLPDDVRVALQNVKGQLRKDAKKGKKRGRPRKDASANGVAAPAAPKAAKVSTKLLEKVEDGLDELLTLLRGEDPSGVGQIVGHLKAARRAAIWFMGGA